MPASAAQRALELEARRTREALRRVRAAQRAPPPTREASAARVASSGGAPVRAAWRSAPQLRPSASDADLPPTSVDQPHLPPTRVILQLPQPAVSIDDIVEAATSPIPSPR